MIQKFVLPSQDKAGRTYFEDVRTGNFNPIFAATNPQYRDAMTPALFSSMQTTFGSKPVKNIKVVGARVTAYKNVGEPGFAENDLTYEYEMGDRYVIAEIAVQDLGRVMQINGIHVQALTRSIEQMNGFTFNGKSVLLILFLVLVVLNPIFIAATAFVCWRTSIPRFKWLWRIFVLLGITGLTLNWTDGNVQFLPFHFDILGAGFSRQGYGPWIFEISLPLGAILFWIMRRRWIDQSEEKAAHFN